MFFCFHVLKDHSQIGRVNVDDLKNDRLIMFQHKHYLISAFFMILVFPSLIAYFG